MSSAFALFLPLALLPLAQPDDGQALLPDTSAVAMAPGIADGEAGNVWQALSRAWQSETMNQVRIERRVIIRISPRMPMQDTVTVGPVPPAEPKRFEERRMGKCLPIKGIASAQISRQGRLLLFMRDHRIVSAKLEKSCSVRDFYSGFYVEDSDDGMICAGRDTLHSRAGVNCALSRLHRLVPAEDLNLTGIFLTFARSAPIRAALTPRFAGAFNRVATALHDAGVSAPSIPGPGYL